MINQNIFQQASSLFWVGLLCLFSSTSLFAQTEYSGEALFRAVYFGQGSFAKSIPELDGIGVENHTANSREIDEARQFEDQIVRVIQTEKPGFFSQFQKDMYSGKHVSVRNQLQNGKNTLYWAASQLGEDRDPALEQELIASVNQQLGGKDVTPEALRNAVENHIAVNSDGSSTYTEAKYIRYIAYVFIIVYVEWYFDPEEEMSATYQDKLVNSIVEEL